MTGTSRVEDEGSATERPNRDSTASRVADALRTGIIEGRFQPGQRLPEEPVRAALEVSRSTLREAFRLLIREGLLVHELSRGVFVRELTMRDISDLYHVRRVLECEAVRQVEALTPAGLRALVAAIEDGRRAADEREWGLVAAASIRFHEALVGLAGSDRLNRLITQTLAEFRLAYAFMADTRTFHLRFLDWHGEIADAVCSGDLDGAASMLDTYLHEAERAVLANYRPDAPVGT